MLVKFYTLPFQFESRIRPDGHDAIINCSMGEAMEQDVNIPGTFDRVGTFDRDLPPSFSDFNYAVIDGHGFWFFAHTHAANRDGTMTCTFTRDPWYEYGNSKASIKAAAMPEPSPPYLSYVIAADTTAIRNAEKIHLPKLPKIANDDGDLKQCYFVQCTFSGSGLRNLHKYGWFVSEDETQEIQVYNMVQSGVIVTVPSQTLKDTINDLIGILRTVDSSVISSSILDLSISERCPYHHYVGYKDGTPYLGLNKGALSTGIFNLDNPEQYEGWEDSVTFSVPMSIAQTCSIQICDPLSNPIGTIPTSAGTLIQDNFVYDLKIKTISDYTGIYTHVFSDIFAFDVVIPEGHLPWVGSQWQDYQAQSMSYDREMLALSIEKARTDAVVNTASSVSSGLLTGAISGGAGVATTIIGIGSTAYQTESNISQLMKEQRAKETMYKSLSSSAFCIGYGLSYILNRFESGCFIGISKPVNLSAQFIIDYHKSNGYPADGTHNVQFKPGYWKGYAEMIMSETGPITIPKLMHDMLNQELTQGIRLVHGVNDI